VFPDQLACLENIIGDREIPDHPLVRQTIEDCLTEAMDIDRFIAVLAGLESGAVQVVCRDLAEPSPLAAEIVNARVYSFLDGAPLEERRTRAVKLRRGLEPRPGGDLDSIDAAAVARVRREIRPEAANVEEFHDALQLSGFLREEEGRAADWLPYFDELARQRRATRLILSVEAAFWIAAERWPLVRAVYPGLRAEPPLSLPLDLDSQAWDRDDALVSLLRARLAIAGPVNELSLATQMMISPLEVRTALCRLETEGFVLRGRYTPDDDWCERGLVARIQRYARDRRRCAIEPVTAAEYVDFLFRWQHVHPETRMQGAQGLGAILTQLEGFEGPAFSWESSILPARVENYADTDLDRLCQCGQFSWLRLRAGSGTRGPIRTTPIVFVPRRSVARWCSSAPLTASEMPSAAAQTLQRILADGGALFFDELVERSGLPPVAAERALAELVAVGTVTSDAFAGLRALLVPESMKQRYKGVGWGLDQAGRWSLLTIRPHEGTDRAPEETEEHAARVLLRRYGVMFRGLLTRETCAPPWQSLVRIYRRLEARGEIRGGRFVAGPFGEQYALAEALEPLRSVRRQSPDADLWISATDPLNLTGIVSEGVRISPASGRWILYRRGEPVAVDDGEGRVSALNPREPSATGHADRFPLRSPPRTPRAYFRRSP
ncbi:MAG: ATP-dependent DNA helicase, partial [Methylotetracoccus sp.]|nr:ATP-dependent DNA helicase [Methylotetracoccus sp.]